ncbi:hypothetical protein AAFN47_06015 [Hoeflea sp. CAU 1731]
MSNLTRSAGVAGLFAVAAIAVTALGAAPASAYECKNSHHYQTGAGNHPQVTVAQMIAKKSWQGKIKSEYGLPWSVWDIAKGKQVNCTPAGGGQTICVARARPCKYVTG